MISTDSLNCQKQREVWVTISNNVKIIKQANRYLVLQCILAYGPISIEDIVRKTDLSRPTVLNAVKILTEENILIRDGFSKSTGGRTASLISINMQAYYSVGIDFEFPKVRIVLADLKGGICSHKTIEYPMDIKSSEVLSSFPKEIERFVCESGIDRKKIAGVGIGLSGLVDTVEGKSTSLERISGWKNVNIQSILETKLKLPVYLQNDVHLLGMVEKRLYLDDCDVESENFIYIGLRAGIGSVVFINGKPFSGANGNAGFIGHTTLNPEGPKCVCGKRGCLDAYAGELAIIRKYREEKDKRGIPAGPGDDSLKMEDFIRRSKEGDAVCSAILREAGVYLGIEVANLVKTLEITDVVIGGCSNLEDSEFLRAVKESAEDNLPAYFRSRLAIGVGRLTETEYPLGGCFLVFDHLFHKPHLTLSPP